VPAALTDREEQAQRGLVGFRGRLTSWSDSSATETTPFTREADAPIGYRLGDDVVHPSFGEGVVTGVEPGGIVVIRFSRDRSERKLVADLAPIAKR
jgi:DNA helicase-2/ATP-dependent DNA helicase PcrA